MGIVRAEWIVRMRSAHKRGETRTSFYNRMRAAGPVYRKADFFADWRTTFKLDKVEGAARFVRRDRRPAKSVIAEVDWKLSQEYMYVVKALVRRDPSAPITERMVNIQSDIGLTIAQIEEQTEQKWLGKEKYPEELVSMQVWTAMQRGRLQ